MSVALAFRFPSRRYHATPFGHHVNEGLIEWPPSPWRLLRALISVGHTSGAWYGPELPREIRSLVEKLAAELPHYHLPPAVGAHSRHYMPTGVLDTKWKVEKTTLVFDTWARIDKQAELVAIWPTAQLDAAELSLLDLLVGRLNYLGRSESWVEGRVLGDRDPEPAVNCRPEPPGATPDRGWEQVALLAPTSAADFATWRTRQLDDVHAKLPVPLGKKPSQTQLRKRQKAEAPYPADLLDCLQKDTTWWRSHGWSRPPGSRRVFYWRPFHAIATTAPTTRSAPCQPVQAMLLSLTNASRNDHALPPITRTLPQAERLHGQLVGAASRIADRDAAAEALPPELTGCDHKGNPRRGPHGHAHYIPLDLDDDGHLDHVLVWAPMNLSPMAQDAVRAVRTTFMKGGSERTKPRLALAAIGNLDELQQQHDAYGRRLGTLISPSRIWQSLTPFVLPRYGKQRGKNALAGQVSAELDSRGLPPPLAVRCLWPLQGSPCSSRSAAEHASETDGDTQRWNRFRHFKLLRRRGPQPPVAQGFAVQLEFDQPVGGPIALGYGSHFGLGLFCHGEAV